MGKSDSSFLFGDCAQCRVCSNSGLQAPPAFYAGDIENPIAIVAQNPGWIPPTDKLATRIADLMNKATERKYGQEIIGDLVRDWYFIDFTSSSAYARMGAIFGENWLEFGRYFYTNAVRCRTEKNETPSKEMILNCSTWTRNLVDRNSVKAIIFIGKLAVDQYLGDDASKLPTATIKKSKGKILLALPHFVTWKNDDIDGYREMVNKIQENIG